MNVAELAKWWKEAKDSAAPQESARAVLAYVKENDEASLDELRELMTDNGVEPEYHLSILASMVDGGYLKEGEFDSYSLGAESTPVSESLDWSESMLIDGALLEGWTEDEHPRGKGGKFIKGADLERAAVDPRKQAEIYTSLDDANKVKFKAAIAKIRASKKPVEVPAVAAPVVDSAAHQQHALDAFNHLNTGNNLVSLADLRDELQKRGVPDRAHQDAAINALRKLGTLSGVGFEGRHAMTDPEKHARELAATLDDSPTHKIGYVSKRLMASTDTETGNLLEAELAGLKLAKARAAALLEDEVAKQADAIGAFARAQKEAAAKLEEDRKRLALEAVRADEAVQQQALREEEERKAELKSSLDKMKAEQDRVVLAALAAVKEELARFVNSQPAPSVPASQPSPVVSRDYERDANRFLKRIVLHHEDGTTTYQRVETDGEGNIMGVEDA